MLFKLWWKFTNANGTYFQDAIDLISGHYIINRNGPSPFQLNRYEPLSVRTTFVSLLKASYVQTLVMGFQVHQPGLIDVINDIFPFLSSTTTRVSIGQFYQIKSHINVRR